MAQLPKTANTKGNSEGREDYTPIPAGKLLVQIVKSEYKQNKNKNGSYLQLNWEVLNGKYKGRILYDRLNLENPNPIAVEIANKTLNSICKACNKIGVKDSEELHAIPIEITVSVKPATATNPASNEIKAYKPASNVVVEEEAPPMGVTNAVEETTESSKPATKLPWETE